MVFMLQLCGDARMVYGTMCVLETCDGEALEGQDRFLAWIFAVSTYHVRVGT